MTRPAVARILLVITLIVTAHAIKPFSFKNVSSHLLFSSRSFALVLPDEARSRFDHANHLAMTFSNTLFDNERADTSWSIQTTPVAPVAKDQGVVAMSFLPSTDKRSDVDDESEQAIVKVKAATIAQNSTRPEQIGAVEAIGGNEESEETEAAESDAEAASIASTISDSDALAEPTALPVVHAFNVETPVELPTVNVACALSKVKPINLKLPMKEYRRVELIYHLNQPAKSDCEKQDIKRAGQIRLIALIENERKIKEELSKLHKSLIPILECEDEGTEVVTEEESTTGPLQFSTQIQEPLPFVIPEIKQQSDSCSMQPEE